MKYMLPSQFTSGENSRNENKLPLNNSHEKVHDRVIHNHQKLENIHLMNGQTFYVVDYNSVT